MKQRILLILLALGMSGITIAQNRVKKVGKDGYEWFDISNEYRLYGVEDISGKIIVPMEYDVVTYIANKNPILTGFLALRHGNEAWFNKNGKCIIPYTKRYTMIYKYDDDVFGTYYVVKKLNGGAICDRNGNEVLSLDFKGIDIHGIYNQNINGIEYFFIRFYRENLFGLADANGNIIVESTNIPDVDGLITTTNNPLANNGHDTLADCVPAR